MKLRHVLPVFLLVVSAAALLPVTGIYTATQCDWKVHSDADTTTTTPKTLALSVRSGDNDLTAALRSALNERLEQGGVTQIVDNPQTRPRAVLTIEEMRGRWTPFYAPLSTKAHLGVDRKDAKGKAESMHGTLRVDGACWGLVNKDRWRADVVEHIAGMAADALLSSDSLAK
jgi:hypothetical protein